MQFLREIFDYLFPRESSYRKITDQRWIRIGSQVGPIAATIMVVGMLFSALLLLVLKKGIGLFALYVFFVTSVITLILNLVTRSIRRRNRDPALIRFVMMLFPLRGVLIVISSLAVPIYMQEWKEDKDDISQVVAQKIDERRVFLEQERDRLERYHQGYSELIGNFLKTGREDMARNFEDTKKRFFKMMEEHQEKRSKEMAEFWVSVRKFEQERAEQIEKNKREAFLAFERRIGFGPYLAEQEEKEGKIREESQRTKSSRS